MTMLLMMLAGWINKEQQHMIEYLREENSILKSELLKATGKKRIILNDSQRRRLAILAKKVGRKALSDICGVFSPDTLSSVEHDTFSFYFGHLPCLGDIRFWVEQVNSSPRVSENRCRSDHKVPPPEKLNGSALDS